MKLKLSMLLFVFLGSLMQWGMLLAKSQDYFHIFYKECSGKAAVAQLSIWEKTSEASKEIGGCSTGTTTPNECTAKVTIPTSQGAQFDVYLTRSGQKAYLASVPENYLNLTPIYICVSHFSQGPLTEIWISPCHVRC